MSEKSNINSLSQSQRVVLLLFFLSGACGLIYEVIWVRMLGLVFGTTVYAVSTVLTAYMAGLAIGSFWFGRVVDKKKNPLSFYGYLEIGIGLYCFFIPVVFPLLTKIYIDVYQVASNLSLFFTLARFLLSFIFLVIPTILMGATLPAISKFVVRNEKDIGGGIGKIYAINTFGAVTGCFVSGFILIPLIGVKATIVAAAVINLCIGLIAIKIQNGQILEGSREIINEARNNEEERSKKNNFVLVVFALSGFSALSLEVLWTRILVMVVGSSVYAFSTMLTTFLCGIALGSFVMGRFVDRYKNLLFLLGAVQIVLGLSVLVMTPALGSLPYMFLRLFKFFGGAWHGVVLIEFLISFFVMIIPTVLFGAVFPIVGKICAKRVKVLGKNLGNIYSANTVGCIGGTLVTSFLLIPLFGIQKTLTVISATLIVMGIVLFFLDKNRKLKIKMVITSLSVVLTILFVFIMPRWDRAVLDSGVYVYAQNILAGSRMKGDVFHRGDQETLYYKEGVDATVSVHKGKYLFMRINGKTDASTSPDMMTQHLVSHLPLLFHKDPKKALVIGLASGTSLGSALLYPLKEVDCAEISPEVVEASRYFKEANGNALEDKRVNLHIVDGRNFLTAIDKKYDIIISEPSNPWISGVSNLFTQDFYKLCFEKLNDGGLMCQWFQFYRMSPENLNIALNTFLSVFPSVTVWSPTIGEVPMGDILMVGSKKEDFAIDLTLLGEKFKEERVRDDLSKIGIDGPFSLLGCFLIGEENVYRNVYKSAINTDDHPVIEFQAPKTLYREVGMSILDYIREHTGCGSPTVSNCDKGGMLDFHYKLGLSYSVKGKHIMAIEEFKDCLDIDPNFTIGKYLLAMSLHHLGKKEEAVKLWEDIIETDTQSKEAELSREQLTKHAKEVWS